MLEKLRLTLSFFLATISLMQTFARRLFKSFGPSLLLIGLVWFGATQVLAATFEEDYQGYLKTYDAYKLTYDAYVTTRSQYLTYGTLTSKNEALTAVKDFLINRDTVLASYFSLLSLKNTDTVYASLTGDEIEFLNEHKSRVPAVATLDDAVKISDEVEERNIKLQILAKKIVATVITSKINSLKLAFTVSENEAKNLVTTLKNTGHDVSVLERWLVEAKNKELLAEGKLAEVADKISKLSGANENSITTSYNEIQLLLLDANQYLKEALKYLKEIADTIKYGNY